MRAFRASDSKSHGMSLAIIINPISGGGGVADGRAPRRAAAAALSHRPRRRDVRHRAPRPRARAGGRGGRRAAPALVVAWGGDGTINEVASRAGAHGTPRSASCHRDPATDWRERSDVPDDPTRAITDALPRDAAPHRRRRAVTAEWFFSVAGIGFDAHVAACFDRAGIGRRGLADLRPHHRSRAADVHARRYTIDGVRTAQPALLVTVANSSQFGNGARIAPTRRLDDGLLDLVVFEERRGWRRCWRCRGCSPAASRACAASRCRKVERVTDRGRCIRSPITSTASRRAARPAVCAISVLPAVAPRSSELIRTPSR